MSLAHLHLILNHLPTLRLVFAGGLFGAAEAHVERHEEAVVAFALALREEE